MSKLLSSLSPTLRQLFDAGNEICPNGVRQYFGASRSLTEDGGIEIENRRSITEDGAVTFASCTTWSAERRDFLSSSFLCFVTLMCGERCFACLHLLSLGAMASSSLSQPPPAPCSNTLSSNIIQSLRVIQMFISSLCPIFHCFCPKLC